MLSRMVVLPEPVSPQMRNRGASPSGPFSKSSSAFSMDAMLLIVSFLIFMTAPPP